MIIISTRKKFTDPDHLCKKKVTKEIDLTVNIKDIKIPEEELNDEELLNKLSNTRILIIVHGYNNNFKKTMETYKKIYRNLKNDYDHIIGFMWAGGDHFVDYYTAKEKLYGVGHELRYVLNLLKENNKKVDIMAHSLGNVVVFDSLTPDSNEAIVNNFFSLAAAVDNNSLNEYGYYNKTLENFKNIFICYSAKDSVTGFIRKTSDWDFKHGALGHELPYDIDYFVSNDVHNVHFINCTEVVSRHGSYKKSTEVYEFIRSVNNVNEITFTFKNL